jgi:hypothetical protein
LSGTSSTSWLLSRRPAAVSALTDVPRQMFTTASSVPVLNTTRTRSGAGQRNHTVCPEAVAGCGSPVSRVARQVDAGVSPL